jgi:hypothetical protein
MPTAHGWGRRLIYLQSLLYIDIYDLRREEGADCACLNIAKLANKMAATGPPKAQMKPF